MNWTLLVVIGLLVAYVLSELRIGGLSVREAFTVLPRADIGLSADGWGEVAGYVRDLRYTEAFVDVQGSGVATDFCRAVHKKGDPASLQLACALGQRDGMSTLEYKSRTVRDGMRFGRDDYWKSGLQNEPRMSYCRILKDETTGEWSPSCVIPGRYGFKREEVRDSSPPAAIQKLLEAYDGILTWFRWREDRDDFAGVAAVELYGAPVFPTLRKPIVSRGLQLNRWSVAEQQAKKPAPPLRDYLRWGEEGTLTLDQVISPRQIRAISFWVWWDAFEKEACILDCSRDGGRDRFWIGIQGGPRYREPAPGYPTPPATELSASALLSVGRLTEPMRASPPPVESVGATYVFEIWDDRQRIMRLESPQGAARTGVWQHVALTATDDAAWWPTWQIWLDGILAGQLTEGRLSPATLLTDNYIGRNMRGCLQDFRVYRKPLSEKRITDAIEWGRPMLHPQP